MSIFQDIFPGYLRIAIEKFEAKFCKIGHQWKIHKSFSERPSRAATSLAKQESLGHWPSNSRGRHNRRSRWKGRQTGDVFKISFGVHSDDEEKSSADKPVIKSVWSGFGPISN